MKIPLPSSLLAAWILAGLPAQAPQGARDLAALLPEKTHAVVDLVDGAACAEKLLGLLEPLPRGVAPEVRAGLMGLPLITRAATGRDLEDLLDTLMPAETAVAIYPGKEPFPVFLSRIEDAAEVRRIYKKIRAQGAGPVPFDIRDGVLTVTRKPEQLQRVLRFRQRGGASLLANAGFRERRAAARPGAGIRYFVDLQAVEVLAKGKFFSKLDDGARLLVGPIVRAVDLAERADGRLDIEARGLRLHGTLDAALGQDRVARLTAQGSKERVLSALPEGTLACLSLDRDFGEVLRHPDAWLGDDGQLGVANFLSFIDLLLSGASFMEDLVPNIELPVDIFVTKSTPGEDDELPRVRLPAFTLSFGLGENAKATRRILEKALVTITAVSNPDRLRAKKAPLRVRQGRRGDYRYQFVSFGEFRGIGDPPTEHGLSPTLLFAAGRGILASTVDGAVRMAEALQKNESARLAGDYLALRGAAIADLLRTNIGILSVDRVLKEGGSRRAAKAFFDGLAAIAGELDLDARVTPRADETDISIELRRQAR